MVAMMVLVQLLEIMARASLTTTMLTTAIIIIIIIVVATTTTITSRQKGKSVAVIDIRNEINNESQKVLKRNNGGV